MSDASFTIHEYGLVLVALTDAFTSGAIRYADALLLMATADKMAKAGIA